MNVGPNDGGVGKIPHAWQAMDDPIQEAVLRLFRYGRFVRKAS